MSDSTRRTAPPAPSLGQTTGPTRASHPSWLPDRALQTVRPSRLQMSTGPGTRAQILPCRSARPAADPRWITSQKSITSRSPITCRTFRKSVRCWRRSAISTASCYGVESSSNQQRSWSVYPHPSSISIRLGSSSPIFCRAGGKPALLCPPQLKLQQTGHDTPKSKSTIARRWPTFTCANRRWPKSIITRRAPSASMP